MSQISTVFMNGRSQAVRIPKECRLDCEKVTVSKLGESVIISPMELTWDNFFDQESVFDDDFLQEREQNEPQERTFF